jgi:GntR family transcriptional regulator, transcriptional repressor for pyruvate dehydrogenase complex
MSKENRESVVQNTVEGIKDFIKKSEMNGSRKLPTERAFTAMFSVSRSTVREALRILEAAGIIEIKPTKGSYIVKAEDYNASTLMGWFTSYEPEILHLLETRLSLEPMAAFLAAERATDEHIKKLEEAHEEFIEFILQNDPIKITLGDEKFHKLIFEAAQNPLLENLHSFINAMLIDYRRKVFSIPKEAMKAVSQHDEILRQIREHNSNLARENMIQHLNISKRGLLETVEFEKKLENSV